MVGLDADAPSHSGRLVRLSNQTAGVGRRLWRRIAVAAARAGAGARGVRWRGRCARRSTRPATRRRSAPAGDDHALERLQRPRARRDQAGGRRLPPVAPVDHRQDGRRRQRRQDHRGDPRRQRARRGAVVHRRQHRRVLLLGRLDRPQALHGARPRRARACSRRRSQTYTQYKGMRCALPMLADTYGLYYNKALFKKAGITAPPKTMSELTADAKKLTERNADGSQGRRLRPRPGLLRERAGALRARCSARKWVDGQGKSVARHAARLGGVHELAEGPHRLLRLRQARAAGRPAPATSSRPPTRSSAASWRWPSTASTAPRSSRPSIPTSTTAPRRCRSADSHPELYGAGYVTGNIVGIPKSAKHKDAAWELVKYLTTDEHALRRCSPTACATCRRRPPR